MRHLIWIFKNEWSLQAIKEESTLQGEGRRNAKTGMNGEGSEMLLLKFQHGWRSYV